ncbi:MAG: hypothetical protein WKF47_14770 [Geodermatophilaceae bacterium]
MSSSIDQVSVPPSVAGTRLRRLGLACLVSGVLGVLAGAVTLGYPPAVPEDQWSYPFPVGVQWALSIVLALTHALTLAGFLGLIAADPHRRNRAAVIGIWVAVLGYAGLTVCELLSGAIGSESNSSSLAGTVGSAFGVASLLTAIGSVVAGVVIVKRNVWHGLGRWMVLASGVIIILLVTPANISGDLLLRTLALTLWSLTFIPLGRAISASAT